MKFEECKIGNIVTPKTNALKTLNPYGEIKIYLTTAKSFVITGLNYGTKTIDIKPMDDKIKELQSVFVFPACLNPASAKFSMSEALHGKVITRPQTADYKLDFEVRREENELSAYYHGVKLATVKCHPDDAYDEEFGLNLLLRRACQKLKDEHTVVETVEGILQKP